MRSRRAILALILVGAALGASALLRPWPLLFRGSVRNESTPQSELLGSIRDDIGPVSGARVRFKGSADAVESNAEGRFHLASGDSRSRRVTAWKERYFIAGGEFGESPLNLLLTRLPETDSADYVWVDPTPDSARQGNCGNCHAKIYQEWAASGHARSARGLHFRNLYDGTDRDGHEGVGWGLLRERPEGSGVCAACHAPTAGFGADTTKAEGVAAHGVHCDYCHKISGVGNGTIGLTHGRFNLDLLRPKEGQLFFGPLDDVDRGEDAYSPLYKDSKYCASCHEGIVFGVHVYSTYSEWQGSAAKREGKQCQSCHMKPTGTMTNISPDKGGIERDSKTLSNHRFFAGSQEEMLGQSLKASVRSERKDDAMHAEIEVRAEAAGHRVPTGFIDRHLMLVVEPLDKAGRTLAALDGPRLPKAAGIPLAGQSGKLYAKLLKDSNGVSPAQFWNADPEAQDTRLIPGQPDQSLFTFPSATQRIHIRLVYRRFWQEVAVSKGWHDNEIVVIEQTVACGD
jgi:hypothetical protein